MRYGAKHEHRNPKDIMKKPASMSAYICPSIARTVESLERIAISPALSAEARDAAQWAYQLLSALRAEAGMSWEDGIDSLHHYAGNHISETERCK